MNPIFVLRLLAAPWGRVLETLANGAETRNHFYNSPGLLLRIDGDRFTEDITRWTGPGYYDGRIKTMSFTYNWSGKPADYAVQYTYDDVGQLTSADNNLNNAWDIGIGNTISYDANGNILDLRRGSTTKNYAYYAGTNKVLSGQSAGLNLVSQGIFDVAHPVIGNHILASGVSGGITSGIGASLNNGSFGRGFLQGAIQSMALAALQGNPQTRTYGKQRYQEEGQGYEKISNFVRGRG